MSLVKFSNQFPTLFDRFFDNDLFDWSNKNFSLTNTTLPSVNILEDDNSYEVEMAAPSLNKDDFKIELNNDVLTISSEKQTENETKEGQRYTRKEFSYQSFSRSFTLPDSVDNDKIKAKYENGVLRVIIPKREDAKPRPVKQIAIE
ncbi:MAG TPA: Hsp20/alpha crystallin family protein [Bacteroidales bacterium]|nr:heat-shock protein [Rikenellaceae bacterium]HON54641.1 Hsp20/alpha crystallin family protein [Bacteroidales bacterium]HRR50053.1 Hsp20/alpha crystallin family protein [Bacteroidales bacterium]HRT84729.1 Hsp20/alpha crystallin family protein [Bacteroidales bacterium]